jgi:hypothetical protein
MTHYDTLEVSPQASQEVIRAAYKSLMQRFHPDKNPGNEELARRAGLITLAYDTLSDHARRSAYDQSLQAAQQAAPPTPRGTTSRSSGRATHSLASTATPQSRAVTFFWGIVIVIVVAGGTSLWLLKSSAARKMASIPLGAEPANMAANNNGAAAEASMPTAGLAPLPVRLGTALEVRLGDAASNPNRAYVLTIPSLMIFIGRTDAPEFARYLRQQEFTLQDRLSQQLAFSAQPDELIKASGQQYLRRLIFDALVELTGTETIRQAAKPPAEALAREDAAAGYGVIGVSLPDSFTLR